MAAWNELLDEFSALPDDNARVVWLTQRTQQALNQISARRNGRNVIFYASAFLQKPSLPQVQLQIMPEDINGFMSVMYGMSWDRGLTLLLHTPGGVTNAAETIVAYLNSKFADFEVIVPAYAMSAGTMISLASDCIIMGRQSQLGPIDSQLQIGGGMASARAIVDQFEKAKADIVADLKVAHLWAPVLQSLGPSLLQEAQNALDYGERMVATWLAARMLKTMSDPTAAANSTAKHFNDASLHKSHGRRIGRDEARSQKVVVEDLEADQELQDAVLTAYHLITIAFEKSPATKSLISNNNRMWVKN